MDTYAVVDLHAGILFSSKKEWIIDSFNHMDESQQNHAKWELSDEEGYIPRDSIYRKFQKMQMTPYIDSSSVIAWGWGGGEREGFKGAWGNLGDDREVHGPDCGDGST